uniref:Uncharacterized protein n=1 Tax=Steinernema glaseri TaxID=37863 RepID=A0A1I7Z596_9BILA
MDLYGESTAKDETANAINQSGDALIRRRFYLHTPAEAKKHEWSAESERRLYTGSGLPYQLRRVLPAPDYGAQRRDKKGAGRVATLIRFIHESVVPAGRSQLAIIYEADKWTNKQANVLGAKKENWGTGNTHGEPTAEEMTVTSSPRLPPKKERHRVRVEEARKVLGPSNIQLTLAAPSITPACPIPRFPRRLASVTTLLVNGDRLHRDNDAATDKG